MMIMAQQRFPGLAPARARRVRRGLLTLWGLLAWALAGCAAPEPPPSPTWTATGGLLSGHVHALRVVVEAQGEVLYAATEGGVYRSEDQGETWAPHAAGMSNRLVRALDVDRDRQQALYAGTWGGRLYTTLGLDGQWRDVSQGILGDQIVALVVDSQDPEVIHVATSERVYTTRNAGATWSLTALLPQSPITALALDSLNPALVYVATQDGRMYYSTDRAATWAEPRQVAEGLSALVPIPGELGQMYAIAGGKVYRGDDFGRAWVYNDNYMDKAEAQCLAVDPRHPARVLVGQSEGIYRSDDGRATWRRSNKGLAEGAASIQALAFSILTPGQVYAASGPVIYRSRDNGESWAQVGQIQEGLPAQILALAATPRDGQPLFASAAGGGLYASRDGGDTWQLLEGLPSAWVTSLDIPAREPNTLYAGTLEGIPYRSTDQGRTWTASTAGLRNKAIMDLVSDPEQPGLVYLGTWGGGLFGTPNWELGWSQLGLAEGHVFRVVADTRAWRRDIYVLAQEGTYRGSYGQVPGAPNLLTLSWYLGPVAALLPASVGEAEVVVAGSRAPDLAEALADRPQVLAVQGVAPDGEIALLQADPANPTLLYLAINGVGVKQSLGGQGPWESLGDGLAGREIKALVVHPATRDLYVGTDQGVFVLARSR